MALECGNLFSGIPDDLPDEDVRPLLERTGVRVERIVSRGHASPEGFWYDQPRDEWVAVLSGRGRVTFADRESLDLGPGDYVLIPAGCRHRVEWTDEQAATVWLAIHAES
jgi:cupin 2 domain-containing protein